MVCIICNKVDNNKYAICTICFKKAASHAARFFLKREMKVDARLYDEAFQKARLKTLINRYEHIIKRKLRAWNKNNIEDI